MKEGPGELVTWRLAFAIGVISLVWPIVIASLWGTLGTAYRWGETDFMAWVNIAAVPVTAILSFVGPVPRGGGKAYIPVMLSVAGLILAGTLRPF